MRRSLGNVPALLSAREAALSIGVTERTVRNWISSGKLPAERTPAGFRIRSEDLPAPALTTASQVPEIPSGLSDLVALVDRLTRENRDLASLVGTLQERCSTLQAQLALPAPDPLKIAPERDSDAVSAGPSQQPSDQRSGRRWWQVWQRSTA